MGSLIVTLAATSYITMWVFKLLLTIVLVQLTVAYTIDNTDATTTEAMIVEPEPEPETSAQEKSPEDDMIEGTTADAMIVEPEPEPETSAEPIPEESQRVKRHSIIDLLIVGALLDGLSGNGGVSGNGNGGVPGADCV